MIQSYHADYTSLGISVIPIEWDVEKKEPKSHRKWGDDTVLPLNKHHNALMIKTCNDYACLDFDLKNTERKTIFDEWKTIVLNQWPDLYDKLFVEKTRNAGYHVWLKYSKLEKKLALADSEKGNEVIALYAKGPLVYTFPTPGYTEISGSMLDISDLTDKEFEYLISTSQAFNEYKPTYDPNKKAVAYPAGHESLLSQFDAKLPDEQWEMMLNTIGLQQIPNYTYHAKDKFVAFKRAESISAAISAKVYFKTKRLMLFTASMHMYPNWHNKHDYSVWSLPPSFVLFYKNSRDWEATIQEINGIIESTGMEIDVPLRHYGSYPLHIFPHKIAESMIEVCEARSLSIDFVATAGLWTISSLAGTRYQSDFNGDGKNILFCIMIAPVSAGKTPAFKSMCETPLKPAQEIMDAKYSKALKDWEDAKEDAKENKKAFKDKRPSRYIPIAVDGTTEGYIHKSMGQPNGIGVYQDEAETILNAGNFKATNDAISFFTQAFSGGRVAQIRADETKERVVPNLNLNILMGTQPDRLKNIFTEDRLASGFASRFIMIQADYKELNINSDPFAGNKEMCQEWVDIVTSLFHSGRRYNTEDAPPVKIIMRDDAKDVYRTYHKRLLTEANTRISTKAEHYIIGTEAKMSAYFPRLVQILAILHNHTGPEITPQIVHDGYTLYRYYAESTIKIIHSLHGQIETGLPEDLETLYQALPDEFELKEAADTCIKLNLKPRRFEISVRRKDFGQLFVKMTQGRYRKK